MESTGGAGTRSALSFGVFLLLAGSLRWRGILQTLFETTNTLGQPFSEFRQFLRAEQNEGDKRYQ